MNLNNNANDAAMKMPEPPMMTRGAVGGTQAGVGSRMLGDAGYGAQQTQQPESELQYAARAATDSLMVLEKSVYELVERLQMVLSQEPPSPSASDKKAQRSCTSQIANALLAHAEQTDNITGVVRSLLRRIVL